ncbi:uncharacterized protein LOC119977490 [Scyliorhinus canicula]|uniref:uncharacterized protein LOC119977490 n=1 Tax=Scyliorhinus canicula TaxID=7830 RepID=UPI0018F3EDBF|nr:uncharacterized protein LOC119977490 [Scyliorhinus canicula]
MAALLSEFFSSRRNAHPDHCETTGCRAWQRVRTETIPNDFTSTSSKSWCAPHITQETDLSYILDNFLARAFLVACLIVLICFFINFIKKHRIQNMLMKMWEKYACILKMGSTSNKKYLKSEKKRKEIKRFRRGLAIQEKIMRKLQQMEMKIREMEEMIMKFAKKMTRRVTGSECTSRSSSCVCSRCHTPSVLSTELDSHRTI